MKRYKLKKDLPTFNAGDKFYIDEAGNLQLESDYCGVCAYAKSTLEKFPNILKDWFEEIAEKPKTVWDLEAEDIFWLIRTNNWVDNCIWSGCGYDIDCRMGGNCFLTKGEAEKELTRRKAKAILERDAKGFKPRAKEQYYQVYYVVHGQYLDVTLRDGSVLYQGIRFSSREDAQNSIDNHPEEWKTYLGVEE